MAETYLSREGYNKLVKDLEQLKKRKIELSHEIGEAREKGDLKENAEYHSAKERQAEILRRIHETEEKLQGARIIEELNMPKDEVRIGTTVTVEEKESGEELTYTLVGPDESDPSNGKISVYAPLAQALLGKKPGSTAQVQLPGGLKSFKIIKIA